LIAATASATPPKPRHHDRPDFGIAVERFVQYRHPIGIGQPEVDDESIVSKRPEPLDRIRGVSGLRRRKTAGFQTGHDGLTKIEVIFNDEDGGQCALAHR
jgi:hypothetical protein